MTARRSNMTETMAKAVQQQQQQRRQLVMQQLEQRQ
jgi:hypothetical protein